MYQLRDVIAHLLRLVGPGGVNRTVLNKLVYFAELESWHRYGRPLTGVSFYRFKHGAWAPDVVAVAERVDWIEHRWFAGFYPEHNYRLGEQTALVEFPPEVDAILQLVTKQYGSMTAQRIGTLSKQTPPMLAAREHGESLDLSVVARAPAPLTVRDPAITAAAASFDSSRWGSQEELDQRDRETVSAWQRLRLRALVGPAESGDRDA